MRVKKKLIRKTWPKIRLVKIKSDTFYRVDARRVGTSGKQESFKDKADAEERASKIEEEFAKHGTEALTFPTELRGMALTGDKLLKPYGKTIIQAVEFYRDHLEKERQRKDSAKVSLLADRWLKDKKSGLNKELRPASLKAIEEAARMLKKIFGEKRVIDVVPDDIRKYLAGLSVGLRRKFNIKSRFSQFFNWCIHHDHIITNPCDKIGIHVDGKDVTVFSPAEALKLMTLCKNKDYKDLAMYHAISLFAGLRPSECQLLKWEQINLESNTITVLATTSKTKESRSVPIEANLLTWLETVPEKERTGFVTKQENLMARLKGFRVKLGYRGGGENPEASEWPQDVMRHSYGSYLLEKNKNRAVLAEYMGNSVQMIKRHYKQVVGKSACADYWLITPTYDGTGTVVNVVSHEAARKARGERLGKVLARET